MCLGIPGQVVAIDGPETLTGIVEVSGVRRRVNLACVADPGRLGEVLGAWVLVHVGFAMARIDAGEAARTLAALEELGEAMAEVDAIRASNAMLGETP